MTKLFETMEKIEMLHKLIKDERTGTPDQLARRFGISRGTLYKLIEILKSRGISILYSRSKESFVYEDDIDLEIQFSIKILKNENILKEINAGSVNFSFRPFFYTEE